ncbi:DUF935 domain-containing protein [Candidatus Tokpelaia sp.]|uniref:DUF935 domain-containing protein n=1 Tax=Candidatus Tokpelaia sp. TaxID=2233777 RepID=UPI00123AA8C4|nr:DUF935 domain-containing protein [Candidatus Tokpelaia sp.]KAA6405659.1 DUF935 domain-containing protein [Candidatus Tokpelaia sp.]
MPGLIDTKGRPLISKKLQQELAAPTIDGVRTIWADTVLNGLTPFALADILRQAAQGYPDRFFALAEEMEERDLHYRAVLSTRKNALTGLDPYIKAAGDDKEQQKQAEALTEVISQAVFADNCVSDTLDALAKGYAVIETIWEKTAKEWWPVDWKWRNQRFFQIARDDGETLRLKSETNRAGEELEPYKFIVHKPRLKSGLPIRGGLARLAAWGFIFKTYTIKDWMAFLEVFGMPFRVGRYGASANDDEKRVLITALRNLSTDAAAIIPKEMEIEFVEVKGGSGNAVFQSMAEYLDKQISKAVLGQTMTTDDGASLSQARVHENVRHDIARSDARQLEATLNRDLVRPFIDANFGPQDTYPEIVFPIVEERDLSALCDSLQKLVPLGLRVSEKEIREELGLSEPQKDEAILTPPAAAAPAQKQTGATARQIDTGCGCGQHRASASINNDSNPIAPLEELAFTAAEDYEEVLAPILAPLEEALRACGSYEEANAVLNNAITKMNILPLADKLAALQMLARGFGGKGQNNGK